MSTPTAQPLAIADALKSLGLTKYEALVYIALLRATGATATEIHDLSGVPRASVYPVLERLAQKQLVSVSNTSPKRFNPVRPDDAIASLLQSIENDAAKAKKILNKVYSQASRTDRGDQELIWSIHGDEQIRSRLFDLLQGATERVKIIFFWDHPKNELIRRLCSLDERIRIEIITDGWTGPVPGHMDVMIRQPPKETECSGGGTFMAGGIILIDQKSAMVVMGSRDEGFTALYSDSPGFIRFFIMYWNLFSHLG